jgi:hypothetical protein
MHQLPFYHPQTNLITGLNFTMCSLQHYLHLLWQRLIVPTVKLRQTEHSGTVTTI